MNKFEEQFDIECEFEPLVSSFIDNELDDNAKSDVIAHLASCETCRNLHRAFCNVDSLVFFSDERASRLRSERSGCQPTPEPIRNSRLGRLVLFAIVGTLLLCVSQVLIQDRSAAANPISPEQVAQPMQEMHMINQQQRRDQELMLRVLGMDLRALKLEISLLPEDSQERNRLTQQVDAMLERVRQFESRK